METVLSKKMRGARTPTTSAGTPINAVGIKNINEMEKQFDIDCLRAQAKLNFHYYDGLYDDSKNN